VGVEMATELLEMYAFQYLSVPKNFYFEASTGQTKWKYRGQATPRNKMVQAELIIVSTQKCRDGTFSLVANAFYYVDGLRVYEVSGLRIEARDPNTISTAVTTSNVSSNTIITSKRTSRFKRLFGVSYDLYTGAMAKGIASPELVIACANSGILSSYGAGGLPLDTVETGIIKIKRESKGKPFCVNLIHSPSNANLERECVDILLKHRVRIVEASAFMSASENLLLYKLKHKENKIIWKLSRTEVARAALSPPSQKMIQKLLSERRITQEEAERARNMKALADAVCVESDSGGHTDRRPLHVLFPIMLQLRKRMNVEHVVMGAAGGIGCPAAVRSAQALGAEFVCTGTINQISREAATSQHVRKLLSEATYSDVTMTPAADMFELGVELQVLSKKTMMPKRGTLLYRLYKDYPSLEQIPSDKMKFLEEKIFKKSVQDVWGETVSYYINRLKDPARIERAEKDGKMKMGLVFKWYLSKSSGWANRGDPKRKLDYQIWCGPCIGSYNLWVQGSKLDPSISGGIFPSVVDINKKLMMESA